MLAHELAGLRDFARNLIVDRTADTYAARVGQAFEAGRHVNAVAEQIFAFNHDIAEIDADAKAHTPLFGQIRVAILHAILDFKGATHCLNRAGKLCDHAVAGSTENTAVVAGN